METNKQKIFWDMESLIEHGIDDRKIRGVLKDALRTGEPQGVEFDNKILLLDGRTKKIIASKSTPMKLMIFGNGNMLLYNKNTGELIENGI